MAVDPRLGLFSALDIAAFVELEDERFELLEPPPAWMLEALDGPGPYRLEETLLFLDTFLEEARAWWLRPRPGTLRSGPWTEAIDGGPELTLEALAVYHRDRRLLLIERLGSEFEQLQTVLQSAREAAIGADRAALLLAALEQGRLDPNVSFVLASDGECVETPGQAPFRVPQQLLREIGSRLPETAELRRLPLGEQAFECFIAPLDSSRAHVAIQEVEPRRTEPAALPRNDELLAALPVAALRLDAAGAIRLANQAAAEAIGRPASELQGRNWTELFADTPRAKRELSAWAEAPDKAPTLQVEGPEGRPLALDIRRDPTAPDARLLFLSDGDRAKPSRPTTYAAAAPAGMLGESGPMRDLYRLIEELAPLPTTVLIQGETGVGKELVARALHQGSPRRDRPFVALNSAGLPEALAASQLFGHKRGSFTGAIQDHRGLFEAAHGGTLFLDEIGDLTPSVQTALLRVIQEREILRVGETQPRKVDVRLLVATHRDLEAEVAAGRFRADLFYRIRVARVRVPPLCERWDDLEPLAESFLADFRALSGKPVHGLSRQALEVMKGYNWPGNVRELRSAVEFAAIRTRSAEILAADLPPEIGSAARTQAAATPEEERARILEALEQADGNRSRAARLLGVSRATFYRRLEQLGLDPARNE